MEGRLGEPPLPQMDGIFARQQAVAEDAASPAQHDAAAVVRRIADQQVLDVGGVVELELAIAVRRP